MPKYYPGQPIAALFRTVLHAKHEIMSQIVKKIHIIIYYIKFFFCKSATSHRRPAVDNMKHYNAANLGQ